MQISIPPARPPGREEGKFGLQQRRASPGPRGHGGCLTRKGQVTRNMQRASIFLWKPPVLVLCETTAPSPTGCSLEARRCHLQTQHSQTAPRMPHPNPCSYCEAQSSPHSLLTSLSSSSAAAGAHSQTARCRHRGTIIINPLRLPCQGPCGGSCRVLITGAEDVPAALRCPRPRQHPGHHHHPVHPELWEQQHQAWGIRTA